MYILYRYSYHHHRHRHRHHHFDDHYHQPRLFELNYVAGASGHYKTSGARCFHSCQRILPGTTIVHMLLSSTLVDAIFLEILYFFESSVVP